MKEAQQLRREKKKTLSVSCKKLQWHMKIRGTVVWLTEDTSLEVQNSPLDPENKDGTAEVEGATVNVATMTESSGKDIAKLQEVCQLWREENSLLKASCGSSSIRSLCRMMMQK